MKATENRQRNHLRGCLDGRPDAWDQGDTLADPLVGPRLVEIREGVLLEHPTKVGFAKDDDVIEALAPGAAEKPLADWIGLHCRLHPMGMWTNTQFRAYPLNCAISRSL